MAVVESETSRYEVILRDNGIGADTMMDDGVYNGYFLHYKSDGKYKVKVKVSSVPEKTKVIVGGLSGAYDPAFVFGSEWPSPFWFLSLAYMNISTVKVISCKYHVLFYEQFPFQETESQPF